MSAGQIQKPGTVSKQNETAEPKAPAVTSEDLSGTTDTETETTQPAAPAKKAKVDKVEKLDKVQKRAKGIKLSPIDVVATEIGYYGNRRIKVGDKFKLDDETDFSERWMKRY